MNGNELLWPGGRQSGTLDASLAEEDLELRRLCLLLFPALGGEGAMAFASSLLTDDAETIRLRQRTLEDLLAHPELRRALETLLGLVDELAFCDRGVRENQSALHLSRLDTTLDGVKKAVLRLGKDISRQGAEILEEAGADNRYAKLLRFTHFRRRLLRLYAQAVTLIYDSTRDTDFAGEPLRALGAWAKACYARDGIPETAQALDGLDKDWKGAASFAVDVCLDSRRNVIGLELAEVRETPYAAPGMLEGAGSGEAREGITSLLAFPQTGAAPAFQEYLLSAAGYEVRGKLTKLRDALMKLPLTGLEELLSFREALLFYTGAAAFAEKLKARGSAVCAPELTEDRVFAFREARLPEQTCTGTLPVPNDLTLPLGGSILLTGPNSSGKTCCLMMAGQLLFLGQLGCLIPASEGAFCPRDRLLTLFAAGESETGEDSRMGLEVQRIRLLRAQMTPGSLLLFNEPMTSTSAMEGGRICVELLADLAEKGIPAILVTHFNHIWSDLRAAFEAVGRGDRLQSLVMTARETPEGLRYLYRLEEAPPPPSSHARAVVAEKGVRLEDMVAALAGRGLDMRPGDPGWERVRLGTV